MNLTQCSEKLKIVVTQHYLFYHTCIEMCVECVNISIGTPREYGLK